jgi:TRAP-type C4-dicarboxylate transport system permease small subunit
MVLLDRLYKLAGTLSGVCIVLICLLITTQVLLNGLGHIAPGLLPSTIPSYGAFAGYLLVGATFFALADTLRSGGHIRVSLVTQRLPVAVQTVLEGLVLLVATAFVGYLSFWMFEMVRDSLRFGDVSAGIVAIPLWIPQLAMLLGTVLLGVALVHTLVDLLHAGRPVIETPDEV